MLPLPGPPAPPERTRSMPAPENEPPNDMYFYGPPRPDERFITHTTPPDQPVAGMNVRHVIKVVSGERAKHIDARQSEVIMDILRWYRQQREEQEQADHEP